MTRENNADTNKTIIYSYDNSGNISTKKIYSYTTAATVTGTPIDTIYYSYDCEDGYTNSYFEGLWGDLLSSYDGRAILYDNIGNPISIGNDTTLSWTQGRRLQTYTKAASGQNTGVSVSYKYNSEGIRTQKTVNGVTHYYTLNGSHILSEEWTTGTSNNPIQHLIVYANDANGSLIGFRYRNSFEYEGVFHEYIYGKNIQGDILYIFGIDGTKYVTYSYDAWGNQTVTYSNVGTNYQSAPGVQYNPFTYRGYYYDEETGLYYLNSRYYNPEWGRFINPDCYLNANGDILGFNMFAYCGNNPVIGYDPSGTNERLIDYINMGGGAGSISNIAYCLPIMVGVGIYLPTIAKYLSSVCDSLTTTVSGVVAKTEAKAEEKSRRKKHIVNK